MKYRIEEYVSGAGNRLFGVQKRKLFFHPWRNVYWPTRVLVQKSYWFDTMYEAMELLLAEKERDLKQEADYRIAAKRRKTIHHYPR